MRDVEPCMFVRAGSLDSFMKLVHHHYYFTPTIKHVCNIIIFFLKKVARRRIAKRNLERLEVLRAGGLKGSQGDAADTDDARDAKRSAHSAPPAAAEGTGVTHDSGSSPIGGPFVVAVLGSGKFGTAICTVMARNGHTVRLLTRRPDVAAAINEKRRHPLCYPDVVFPPSVSATTDPAEALAGVDFVVHAVPVQASQAFLRNIAQFIPHSAPIISLSKGKCAYGVVLVYLP